jgi:hypothetical protein
MQQDGDMELNHGKITYQQLSLCALCVRASEPGTGLGVVAKISNARNRCSQAKSAF